MSEEGFVTSVKLLLLDTHWDSETDTVTTALEDITRNGGDESVKRRVAEMITAVRDAKMEEGRRYKDKQRTEEGGRRKELSWGKALKCLLVLAEEMEGRG